jgi:hypothetical protein
MKYLLFIALFNFQLANSQSLNENVVCNLPAVLDESSGLERDAEGNFWSHNDSGGQPELYQFSEGGLLLHTVKVLNAENVDWEDISLAEDGRMFIGDIGNNNNDREDLKIYIVNINNLNAGVNFRTASTINISYNEQINFPPSDAYKNFDSEALVFKNDSLFLFTKNRTQPFDGKCYQYCLPAIAGNYQLNRSGTFYIQGAEAESRVVGADFDAITNRLALLTSTKVLIFEEDGTLNLMNGILLILSFTGITQKEGICWADSCNLYFSDEFIQEFNLGGKLYNSEICNPLNFTDTNESEFEIFPIPTNEIIYIKLKKTNGFLRNISGRLFTSEGILSANLSWNSTENIGSLNVKNLSKGLYLLALTEEKKKHNIIKVWVN